MGERRLGSDICRMNGERRLASDQPYPESLGVVPSSLVLCIDVSVMLVHACVLLSVGVAKCRLNNAGLLMCCQRFSFFVHIWWLLPDVAMWVGIAAIGAGGTERVHGFVGCCKCCCHDVAAGIAIRVVSTLSGFSMLWPPPQTPYVLSSPRLAWAPRAQSGQLP